MNLLGRVTCSGMGILAVVSALSAEAEMASPYLKLTLKAFGQAGTSTTPTAVVAGRFSQNGDQRDDIVYVVNDSLYYMGASDSGRTFYPTTPIVGGSGIAFTVFAGDVTGDGYDDLVALGGLNFYVFKNKGLPALGTNPFEAPTQYTMTFTPRVNFGGDQAWPTDLDFGDFDGDGDVDLVIGLQDSYYVNDSGDDGTQTATYTWNGNYVISLNQGGGRFATTNTVTTLPNAMASGSNSRGDNEDLLTRVAVGDFDGDGKLDVAFGFHTEVEWLQAPETRWYRGNGNGTFNFSSQVTTGHIGGVEDITAFTPTSPNKRVLAPGQKAYLGLAFETSANVISFNGTSVERDTGLSGTPRGPFGRAWELNGDGLTDLLFDDGDSSQVLVGWNWSTGDSSQNGPSSVVLGTDIQQGDVGDFDHDGKMDVVGVTTNNGLGTISVYFNDTSTNVLTFYSNNDCSGYLGYLSGASDGTYDLTVKHPVLPNDEARSMGLWATKQGTTIKIFDDGGGNVSAGWSEVQTTTTLTTAYCLPSFQLTQSEDGVSVTYIKHTDHSADKDENDVDGKVSRIEVTVP